MDEQKYREILDGAIQGEIEAFHFYQDVANKVADQYLKDMFHEFAAEEQKHQRILEGFREKSNMAIHFASVTDYHVSETVDTLETLSMEMKPADAIALAMKKEEAAMQHYNRLAEACSDESQKAVFLELAAMERGHKARMESAFVDIGYPEVW